MQNLTLILLSLLQSTLLCGGQMLLKIATSHMDKSLPAGQFFLHSLLLNWWLLGCGILFTSAGLLWMYILRHYPFGIAYALTSISFVLGMLAALLVFHEPVSVWQWVGVLFILLGCFLIAK